MADFQSERTQLAELEGLLRRGSLAEAVALGSELVEQFPDSFLIRLQLARALKESKNLIRAEAVLSVIGNRYADNITFLSERGEIFRRLGRCDESEKDYQRIIFLDPFNTKVKAILNELLEEKTAAQNQAFEVVDYQREEFRDDQTVPELVITEENHFEPVFVVASSVDKVDVLAIPVENRIGEDTNADLRIDREQSELLNSSVEEGWIHVDIAPTSHLENIEIPIKTDSEPTDDLSFEEAAPDDELSPEEERAQEEKSSYLAKKNHEVGFITESAAQLYAKQGLYSDALSIYERLNQLSFPGKFKPQIDVLKNKISAERQLSYFEKMLNHIDDKGSHLV